MRNIFLKTLGILLLCISNGFLYAWENNPATSDWNWNYKEDPIINAPSSCQTFAQTNWTPTITVYACSTLGSLSGATPVGTGYFSDNYTKIHTTINRYLPDKYYVVAIPWRDASKIVVTNYIICNKTQEDAFNVTLNKTISRPCESNFYASVSASVTGGSGDYTVTFSATNGNWHQAAQYGGYVEASDFADRTKSKTIKVVIKDNVWGTDLTRSVIFKGVKFSVNTFLGLVYGGTGWSVLGTNEGGGNGTKTFTWSKSFYPTSGYSNLTNGSDGYLCSLGSLQFNEPANTTFFKQYVTQSDCGQSGYTTTSNGTSYYMHSVPIANVSAKIGSATSVEIPYNGSTTITGSSTGGRVDKTYQWYKSSSANGTYSKISGAIGTTYTPTGLTSTTYYKCLVSDPEHTSGVWSNYVTVSVRSPLALNAITIQSGATPTSSGASVTLRANPTGGSGSYSYQWYRDGSAISGATSRDYTATGSGVTSSFYVVVSSDGQTKTSSPISVKWRSALAISAISRSASETSSGSSVTLSITASGGTGSYSYQWYESTNSGTNWTAVGTNSTSYLATGSGQTKYFKVVVTSDGQTKEATTSVKWRSPLAISAISRSASETSSGTSVSLSITASGGTGSYSCQWYESTNSGTNWTAVGTNLTSYSATGSGQTKYFKVVVTSDGQTKEATTSVTWRSPLAAGTISGGGAYHYGANVTLTANPTGGLGGNSYSYQWQSTTGSSWSNIASANTKTYTVTGGNQTARYRVVVSGDGQTQTSNPIDVTWRPELVAGAITGGNVTTFSGNSITLTANPSGGTGSNYTYIWNQSTDGTNWTVISGKTENTCAVTGTEQTVYFKVVVTKDNQTKESQPVQVTWGSALTAGSITSNPDNHSTYSGGSVTLTAHPSVGDQQNVNFVYQWQVEVNSVWNDIQNANSQSYTESNTNASGSKLYKYFRVKVTAEGQTAYSARYEVTWRPALVAGAITGGGGYSYGASATLQAHPSGGLGGNNYSYQWQESTNNSSWSDITGANEQGYSVTGYNQTKYFRVKVSGDNQNKTSESVQVTWRQALAVGSVSGGGVTTYSGGSVTLQAEQPTGGNGTYAYQWQESTDNTNWVNITSAGNYQSYAVSSANPGSSNITKYYRAVVTSDNQSKETQSVTVTYRPALMAAISNNGVSTYSGNAITLTAIPSGGDGEHYSYQWQVYSGSTWNDVQNETGGQFSIGVPNSGNTLLSRNYRVKVSGDSQTAYSAEVTLSWRPALVAGAISGATTTYSGNTVTLAINPSGGDGNYAYQWQVSGDNTTWTNISGAIYSSLAETGVNETNAQATMYYRVVVTGDSQSAVSGVAEVIRRPSLKVGSILGNNIVYGGDAVNLSVVATGGNGSYSYQWYRKSAESDWAAVGTNSPSFSDSFENNTSASISYLYKVVVTGDSQEKTTDVLVCSWVVPMKVDTLIYAHDRLSYGINTPIIVRMINGGGIYDYQWQTKENGVWQDIPDTDEATYIVENLTEAREFRCVVSDSLYPTKIVTTDVVQLDVYPDLIPGEAFGLSYTVVADPVTIGGTTASGGNGVYHYRWEKCSASDNGVFVPTDDATAIINVLPECNTIYRRYDISGDQEKPAFDIHVNVPLLSGSITVDDLEDFYYAGQQLPLLQNETEASGGNVGGSASYQWYSKGESDNAYAPIEGATSADYQPVGLTETTSFYRAIVDGNQELSSNIIAFNIRIPDITISNQKENYCQGDAVSIEASGVEGGEYKWFDATGNLIASGATLNLNSIGATTTLKLRTYINTDELLTEEDVELAVVEMSALFYADITTIDAGEVVQFTAINDNYQYEWDFGDGADGSYESNPWHYYNNPGSFDVRLLMTSSEGCVAETTMARYITVNEATVSTDVDDSDAGIVSIYPNPADSYLVIEVAGESTVIIVNDLGAVMSKTTVFETGRIDISTYPEGNYTVIVVDGNGNEHYEKVIKY